MSRHRDTSFRLYYTLTAAGQGVRILQRGKIFAAADGAMNRGFYDNRQESIGSLGKEQN
jgi:hypothetical protein